MRTRHSQYNTRSVYKVIYDCLQQANYSFTQTTKILYLTFRGPRIVIYSYTKTNEKH